MNLFVESAANAPGWEFQTLKGKRFWVVAAHARGGKYKYLALASRAGLECESFSCVSRRPQSWWGGALPGACTRGPTTLNPKTLKFPPARSRRPPIGACLPAISSSLSVLRRMISFAATPQWHLVPWTGTLVTNAQWSGSSYFKPLNAAISHGGRTEVSQGPGTLGCLPFRLLSQMPYSQGGSSAASLFSSFITLGGVLLELFSVGSWLKGGLAWPVPGTLGPSPFSTFSADA